MKQMDGGGEACFRIVQQKFSFRICIRYPAVQDSKLSLQLVLIDYPTITFLQHLSLSKNLKIWLNKFPITTMTSTVIHVINSGQIFVQLIFLNNSRYNTICFLVCFLLGRLHLYVRHMEEKIIVKLKIQTKSKHWKMCPGLTLKSFPFHKSNMLVMWKTLFVSTTKC